MPQGSDLRYQLGWRRLSEVAFFLGCLFYGAAIWLLAQIFHITSSNYDGLWWWAIGCLPFALLLDTVLLHLLFAGLLALWVGFEVLSLESLIWGIPNGGYSLPLLVAPGLLWAYGKRSAITVGIYVPLLAWWVVLQPIAWKLQANPTMFIGAVGALMMLVASLHAPRSPMAIPYRFYGIALVGATLIPLSFHQFNESVANYGGVFRMDRDHLWLGGLEEMIPIVILLAATLILAVFLEWKSRGNASRPQRSLAESLLELVQAASTAIRPARAVRLPLIICACGEGDLDADDPGQRGDGRAFIVAHSFRPDGGPGPAVRSGGCLPVVVDRAPLRGPVRRLRWDARRVPDVLPLRRSAARSGSLLAEAKGGVPCLTTSNPHHRFPIPRGP